MSNLREFLSDMEIVGENADTTNRLLSLVSQGPAAGKQVHDANIVAVALGASAVAIVTDNIRHFERFTDLIAVEPLP